MSDQEIIKSKLFKMLDEYNDILSKYKELRAKGMAQDEIFETLWNTRKQVTSEILDIILND